MKTWLIINGDDETALEQALKCETDALIINLYKRPVAAKATTTRFVLAHKMVDSPSTLFVRISPLAHENSSADLDTVIKLAPTGIALAECESGMDTQQLGSRLGVLEALNGVELGSTKIIGCIETASALLKMDSYKNASHRLVALIFNAKELAENMGDLAAPVNTARELVLLGATAAGVLAIDGVYG